MPYISNIALRPSFEWISFQKDVVGMWFSTDGQFLLSASRDRTSIVFDTATGRAISSIWLDPFITTCCVLWTDAQTFLMATTDGWVTKWTIRPQTGRLSLSEVLPRKFTSAVHHLEWRSIKGTTLVTVAYEGTCEVWSLTKRGAWKPLGRIRGDHIVGAWFMSDDVMLVIFRMARPRAWHFNAHSITDPLYDIPSSFTVHSASYRPLARPSQSQSSTAVGQLVLFVNDKILDFRVISTPYPSLVPLKPVFSRTDIMFPYGEIVDWSDSTTLLAASKHQVAAYDLSEGHLTLKSDLRDLIAQEFETSDSLVVGRLAGFSNQLTRQVAVATINSTTEEWAIQLWSVHPRIKDGRNFVIRASSSPAPLPVARFAPMLDGLKSKHARCFFTLYRAILALALGCILLAVMVQPSYVPDLMAPKIRKNLMVPRDLTVRRQTHHSSTTSTDRMHRSNRDLARASKNLARASKDLARASKLPVVVGRM